MLRRLAIALAVFLAIPLVTIPAWIALNRTDLPAVDDADQVVLRSEIPPDQNGFEDFVEAAKRIDWPQGADERLRAIRAGELTDAEWLRKMLDRNDRALESLQRGVAATGFQFPPMRDDTAPRSPCAIGQLD